MSKVTFSETVRTAENIRTLHQTTAIQEALVEVTTIPTSIGCVPTATAKEIRKAIQ